MVVAAAGCVGRNSRRGHVPAQKYVGEEREIKRRVLGSVVVYQYVLVQVGGFG